VLAANFELGFCTCRRCNDWPTLVFRAPTMALPELFAPFNSPAGPSIRSSQPPLSFRTSLHCGSFLGNCAQS